MKNNITDKEIFAHIKRTLESQEEDYIPGSWESFLLKQRKRKRLLVWRIASGIAACLLVGYLGSTYFLADKRDASTINQEQMATTTVKAPESTQKTATQTKTLVVISSVKTKILTSTRINSQVISAKVKKTIVKMEDTALVFQAVSSNSKDSLKAIPSFVDSGDVQLKNGKSDSIKNFSDSILNKALPQVLNNPSANEVKKLAVTSKRKVRFGINFSPGVNSTRSAQSFSFQGGVSADISLFSNFQLSTGLLMENQSIVNNLPGIVASSSAPANQTKIKLINLDVPVNITWKFLAQKSNAFYASAGISSLVYLKQEDKNTTYSQFLEPVSSVVGDQKIMSYNIVEKVSVTQNAVTPGQIFDIAGRINIMLGVERKLSDRIYIHLEPYAKIPVSGLAPENLKHTSTGINFKISF